MQLETQATFARRIGKNRSHVTRLKQAGRLVMHEGKIDVDASLALLKDTESPLARDEANRARLAVDRMPETRLDPDADNALAEAGRRLKIAQAEKTHHEAEMARMERERIEGRLAEVVDVDRAAIEMAVAFRDKLENLPDRYAPELAGAISTEQAHAILAEAIESVLEAMAAATHELAEGFKNK